MHTWSTKTAGRAAHVDTAAVTARAWRAGPTAIAALAVGAVICLATWTAAVFEMRKAEAEIYATEEARLDQLAHAFAEHVKRTVDEADQVLRFVRRGYQIEGARFPLHRYAADPEVFSPIYNQVGIIGADGYMVGSSVAPPDSPAIRAINLTDRPHFRFHAENPEDVVRVGELLVGRTSGKASMQITRRLSAADGRFAGLCVVSLAPDYFLSFYEQFNLGEGSGITLVGEDGLVRTHVSRSEQPGLGASETTARARGSQVSRDIGSSPVLRNALARQVGTTRGISAIDGLRKLYGFRAIPQYKLVVFVSMTEAEIESRVAERRHDYLVMAGSMTALVILATTLLIGFAIRQDRLVDRLRRREQELTHANDEKRHLIASVSHELRTPLTSILGYSTLLAREAPDGELKEYATVVEQSGRHLRDLVNNILDLAKLEAGEIHLNPATVDVNALASQAITLYQPLAAERGLQLVCITAAPPAEVVTDRSRVLQILTNLILNGINFTDRGGITVTVAHVADGGVSVAVRDTGIGIPADELARVFGRFKGVTRPGHKAREGAGLGLAVVAEVSAMLGAVVNVSSREGEGTCFELVLPARCPGGTPAGEGKSDE